MSQIKIPAGFPQQISLLDSIITKNSTAGDGTPLPAWLAQHNIDLTADQKSGKQATEQDKIRAAEEAVAKKAFARRDGLFAPVMTVVREGAQVLKTFYKPDYSQLTDWGLPVTHSGRIAYPSSFEELTEIAAGFFTKLVSYGEGKSPLAAYITANGVNVNKLMQDNADAAGAHADAGVAAKAAENATEQRDLLWAMPLKHIQDIADYLKTIYPANPRELGEWGYVVDEGDRKPKLRKSKLGLGETKVVTSVAINSVLTNTGKKEIIIHRGRGTSGTATQLSPGDKMGMVKGYSVITVVNPSTLENGEFTVEINE